MILSTFNFKLVSVVCAILVAAGILFATEKYFSGQSNQRRPYKIRNQINRERPDIIMLGNSILGKNVDKVLFDQELSALLHRPVHSKFIIFPGTYGAFFYLIFSQQIVPSNASHIPVGIITTLADSLTSTGTGGGEHKVVKRNIVEYDPVFFRKYIDQRFKYTFQCRDLWKTFYDSPEASNKMRDKIVGNMFFHRKNVTDIHKILKTRLKGQQLGEKDFIRESFLRKDRNEPYSGIIERSFLPDMLMYTDRFRIFFIVSHRNPKLNGGEDPSQDLAEYLTDYLSKHKSLLINADKFKELDDPSVFANGRYLKPKGRSINTRLLARKIYDLGLIK